MPAEPFAQRSKTTDGGATWSASRVIFDPRQKDQTIANQIIVPTAGPAKRVLIYAFALLPTEGGKGHPSLASSVAAIRSSDGGATWSGSIIVSPVDVAEVFINV